MNRNEYLENLTKFYYNVYFSNTVNDVNGFLFGADASIVNSDIDWYRLKEKETLSIPYKNSQGQQYDSYADFIKGNSNIKKTLILLHGYASKADNMGAWVKQFYELGFNILTPNLRGHGQNLELKRNFGIHDSDDLLKWINKISSMYPDNDIVLMGISMGAAAMLQAMSSDSISPNVKAAIEDCGYRLSEESLIVNISLSFPFLDQDDVIFIKNIINDLLFRDQGVRLQDGLTLEKIAKSSHIPLCAISGKLDPLVSPEVTQNIVDIHNNPKDIFWIVDNAFHPNSIATDHQGYRDIISTFLKSVHLV